ncbi:hypothetical protein F4561_005609 [Lipingzhangella halophila]|uniref:Uncharacterized protein n=1 Tax=Lipingzhangella halophila TaxID=1783352 RepID=A0A7W7W0Y6_9ACTN|nr:hypothetical protein [Lipingzhangella halophila]MBB4929189.1 hypothetical protein [Lipingzhangella halophila]MBB4934715.1 hypothetical protein [Lipingzhangella halophila]
MPDDPRFTFGLIHDVFQTLEKHGYQLPESDRARGEAVLALANLCRTYEDHPTQSGGEA